MTSPSPSSSSYGTVDGVAALSKTWTRNSTFIDDTVYVLGTNPQISDVVVWIDEISAMLNGALKKYGFKTPLKTEIGKQMASILVEEIVADLVKYVNEKGRFFSEKFRDSGYSMWRTIWSDLDAWALNMAPSLVGLGEDQDQTEIDVIGFKDHDEAGDPTFPIFQRKGFGNRFFNWTKPK